MTDALKNVCSFCAKKKEQVKKLIVSDSVAICNECVDLCQDLLKNDDAADAVQKQLTDGQDPKKLKQYLDQ